MDGLSAAASIIAVTSLALQLAESTKKLFEFWDSIQSAPEEINDIKLELESLRNVLEQIGHEAQHQPPNRLVEPALRLCSRKIKTVRSLTTDIESGFTSSKICTRKWGALRAVCSRKKLEKVQSSLERLKATLILVLVNNVGRSCRLLDEHQDHGIKALTHQISDLRPFSLTDQVTGASVSTINPQSHVIARTQEVSRISTSALGFENDAQTACIKSTDPILTRDNCPSPNNTFAQSTQRSPYKTGVPFRRTIWEDAKVVETFLGTFRLWSRTLLVSNQSEGLMSSEEEGQFGYENVFRLIPPSWLVRFGFSYGLSGCISQSPLSGPTVVLDVVRSVPDDSVIFDLCREGRVACVQALLNRGEASAKDVDSQGRTPLYFAAGSCHAELCKLLIHYGADRDSRIYDDADAPHYSMRNPLFAIAGKCYLSPHRVIDTLRLFIDLVDVLGLEDEFYTSGSQILDTIGICHRGDTGEDSMGDVFIWTLEILGPEFWKSLDEDTLNSLMFGCLQSEERTQRLLKLGNNLINARDAVDGYTLLHMKVVYGDPILLLTMGASPNLVGFNADSSPHHETPISLSMYRADTFAKLQRAFKLTRADLNTTISQELEQGPLQHSQWTKYDLVELFSEDLELSPVLYPPRSVCPYCLYKRRFMVQPYWMRLLESVRNRDRSQSIQDIVGTMLSTSSQAAEVKRVDDEEAEPDIDDVHLSDRDDESVSVQSNNEVTRRFSIFDGISVDEEDMCLFCWQQWRETGSKPSLDESKCLGCDQSLSSSGRDDDNRIYCQYCAAEQWMADFTMKQQQKRHPTLKVDSADEEDHYSPYLIHT